MLSCPITWTWKELIRNQDVSQWTTSSPKLIKLYWGIYDFKLEPIKKLKGLFCSWICAYLYQIVPLTTANSIPRTNEALSTCQDLSSCKQVLLEWNQPGGSFYTVIKPTWTLGCTPHILTLGNLHQTHRPHSVIATELHAVFLWVLGRGSVKWKVAAILRERPRAGMTDIWSYQTEQWGERETQKGSPKPLVGLILVGRPGRKEKQQCLFIWYSPRWITNLHKTSVHEITANA